MVVPTTTVAAADRKYVVAGGRTRGADQDFDDAYLNVFGFSMFDSADDPNLVPVSQATWLAPNDVVLGVVQGDDAVAFPIQQMAYHHIANVRIAGEPWLVTY